MTTSGPRVGDKGLGSRPQPESRKRLPESLLPTRVLQSYAEYRNVV